VGCIALPSRLDYRESHHVHSVWCPDKWSIVDYSVDGVSIAH